VTYDSPSDLKIISTLDAIPTVGPDLFDPDEKLDAAEIAEAKLEGDVNDGQEFGADEITALHREAAATYASYRLFVGPEHPEDALSGQLYGGAGEDTMEFATELKAQYESHVATIETSDADDSSDDTDLIFNS